MSESSDFTEAETALLKKLRELAAADGKIDALEQRIYNRLHRRLAAPDEAPAKEITAIIENASKEMHEEADLLLGKDNMFTALLDHFEQNSAAWKKAVETYHYATNPITANEQELVQQLWQAVAADQFISAREQAMVDAVSVQVLKPHESTLEEIESVLMEADELHFSGPVGTGEVRLPTVMGLAQKAGLKSGIGGP